MQPLITDFINFENASYNAIDSTTAFIEDLYSKIVDALCQGVAYVVPAHKKCFYKFWWSQELDCLKDKAIESDRLWKSFGRPRSGPVFHKQTVDKLAYKQAIRKGQSMETTSYTNELQEALLDKSGPDFWKCWKSKFGKKAVNQPQVNGLSDESLVAETFAEYFSEACTEFSSEESTRLKQQFVNLKA
jgi:hypothetical protein